MSDALSYGLRVGTAMTAATALAVLFHFGAPYWAVITVAATLSPYAGTSLTKGLHRLAGTLIGALVGLVFAFFIGQNLPALLIASFIIMTVGQYWSDISEYRYAALLGSLTSLLVLLSIVGGPQMPIYAAMWRTAEIFVGVIVVWFVASWVLPKDTTKALQRHLKAFFKHCCETCAESNPEKTAQKLNQLLDQIETEATAFALEPEHNSNEINRLNRSILFLKRLMRLLLSLQRLLANCNDYWRTAYADQINPLLHDLQEALGQFTFEFGRIKLSRQILNPLYDRLNDLEQAIENNRRSGEIIHHPQVENHRLYALTENIRNILNQINIRQQSMQQRLPLRFAWKINPIIAQHSIKTGLAVVVAVYLWLFSRWPGGFQGIISALIIATNIYITEMQGMGWRRLLGCTLGGAVGLIGLHFLIVNVVDLLIIVFIVGGVFGYFTLRQKLNGYIFLQANIAFALALVQAGGPTSSVAPSLERLSGIFLGILSIMLVNYLVWPLYPSEHLKVKLKALKQKLITFIGDSQTDGSLHHVVARDDKHQFYDILQLHNQCIKLSNMLKTKLRKRKYSRKIDIAQLNRLDNLIDYLYTTTRYLDLEKAQQLAQELDFDLTGYLKNAQSLIATALKHNVKIDRAKSETLRTELTAASQRLREQRRTLQYPLREVAQLVGTLHQTAHLLKQLS